jgi:hypothetical protein
MEYGIVPRLRPLDVGQKLDAAIKLTMRHFWTLVKIVTVLLVPINVISFLITASTLPEDYTAGTTFGGGPAPDSSADVGAGFWVGQLIVNALLVLTFFLGPAVCFLTISQAYLGSEAGWRESLRYALRRFWGILLVILLFGLAMFGCFIAAIFLIAFSTAFPPLLVVTVPAAIVPFVYVGVVWSVALPAMLLEEIGAAESLGRSFRLVRERWWSTFATLLLAWLLTLFVTFVVGGLLTMATFLATEDDSVTAIALNFLTNLIATVLTTPFIAAVTIVLYFDLRVRKEAFDLEMLAGAIGGKPPSTATPKMPWVAPPAAPGWGALPPAPGWGGAPPAPGWGAAGPPAWGAPPPGSLAPGWGQPQQPPQPQASGWAPPQPQPGWGAPPSAPPPAPAPPPSQLWAPPIPPEPPAQDPPDRSSS